MAAAAASSALTGAVVRAATRRQLDDLRREGHDVRRAIGRVGDALASTHDRAIVLDVVLETSAVTVGARGAVFWRVAGGGGLQVEQHRGAAEVEGARLGRGEGIAGRAADQGDVAASPRDGAVAAGEPPTRAALALPVRGEGHLHGVLAVYGRARGGRPFTDDEAETLRAFARQAGVAIDNVHLHEETRRLSITDGLTGVWNRRHFDLRCAEEVDRSVRFGDPFAVVLVDLDDFKQVNDVHGHQAGDAALVELTERLTAGTRDVDLVARYGGEEFAMLLPRTDVEGAVRLAEKMRETVAATPFPVGTGLGITMSVGVAVFPGHGRTVKEVVAAADGALYRAKAAGKNRVEAAERQEAEA